MSTKHVYTLAAMLTIALCIVFSHTLSAEIFYLKDGQIINGKQIKETSKTITIKTEFGNRTVKRSNIKRIKYDERKMEKVYILLKDGSIIQGFIVDQDATKVYFKKTKDQQQEKIILKKNIKQISREKIIPLHISINLRIGVFLPLNINNRSLKPAPYYSLGSALHFPWIKNTRLYIEAGYTRSKCTEDDKQQYLQFIPVNINGLYHFSFNRLQVIPKIGTGISIADFNDGEGNTYRGMTINAIAGLGIQYSVSQDTFFASLWCDYLFMTDSKASIHSLVTTGSVSYRF